MNCRNAFPRNPSTNEGPLSWRYRCWQFWRFALNLVQFNPRPQAPPPKTEEPIAVRIWKKQRTLPTITETLPLKSGDELKIEADIPRKTYAR